MMKIYYAAILIACCLPCQAQEKAPGLPGVENLQDFYRSGIGIRVGWPIAAVTFKHFIQKRIALELIAAPQFGGASLTALLERHHSARRYGVYWYYGIGVDAGSFDGDSYEDYEGKKFDKPSVTTFGIVAIVGIEKNIHETPFSIGIDVKPRIGVYNGGGSVIEGALSIKYIWSW